MRSTLVFHRDTQKSEDYRHGRITITFEGDPEGVTDLMQAVRDKLKGKWLEE